MNSTLEKGKDLGFSFPQTVRALTTQEGPAPGEQGQNDAGSLPLIPVRSVRHVRSLQDEYCM